MSASIREKSMDIALNILKGVNAKYKILLPDGTEYGELEVQENKARKRRAVLDGRKYGELVLYYRPLIEHMKISDIVVVPFNNYRPDALSGAISAWACTHWGKSSVITSKSDTAIEVMRVK